MTRRRAYAVVGAATIGLLVTLACFWPGYMSEDSIEQLAQARSGDYDPWHPPVMSWVWHMTDRAVPGPAGMLILHGVLLWSGLALVAARTIARPALAGAAVLAIGFLPPVFALAGTIWKDVALGVALVLAFGLLLVADQRRSRTAVLTALPLLFYAAAVRYNGASAVLPLALWGGTVLARRGVLAAGATVFAAILVLAFAANAWLSSGRTPRSFHVLFASDIVAVAIGSGEPIPPPAPADEPMSAIVARWQRAIVAHPAVYLRYRTETVKRLLGVGMRAVCYPFQDRSARPNPFVSEAPPDALNRAVMTGLETLKDGPLFRAWVYLVLCVAWGVVGRRRVAAVALAASGILNLLPYYVIAPDCDFRYAWWTVLAALLLPLVVVGRGPSGTV